MEPDFVCDTRNIPSIVGEDYDLVVWDPPHMNCGPNSNMSKVYGYHTTEEILETIKLTGSSVHKITRENALMALKWNSHDIKLQRVLDLLPQWEPLFGHLTKNGPRSQTYWVMLKRIGEKMSVVTTVVFKAPVCSECPEKISFIEKYSLKEVSNHAGGNKATECEIWLSSLNYLNINNITNDFKALMKITFDEVDFQLFLQEQQAECLKEIRPHACNNCDDLEAVNQSLREEIVELRLTIIGLN